MLAMLEEKEIKEIKMAIQHLKIARRSDYLTYHAIIDGEDFNKKVIEPFEKISGWSEEDEKEVDRRAKEYEKEIETAKTIKEKSEILKKILKIGAVGGGIAVGIGAISAVAVHLLKKDKDK